MRISRLETGLLRSPPNPGRWPGALHLRQWRCKNKRRLLFTAAGDSFLSLHQLVSFNALLLPPRCKPKSLLMNAWSQRSEACKLQNANAVFRRFTLDP